ncbi:MAG: hypothetical protein V3573_13980 [Desulfovibrionaceae bacterium]
MLKVTPARHKKEATYKMRTLLLDMPVPIQTSVGQHSDHASTGAAGAEKATICQLQEKVKLYFTYSIIKH